MRKMAIALGIIALATMSQAATFKWSTAMSQALYKAGGASKLNADYTAYIFDANAYSQSTLVSAFQGTGTSIDFAKALDSKAVSASGTLSAGDGFAVTSGQSYDLYVVIVDGENVYVSPDKVYSGPDGDKSSSVQFSTTASSKLAAVTTGYNSAGWYASAPEPTSGLLMLLGMAGLALRRRRA